MNRDRRRRPRLRPGKQVSYRRRAVGFGEVSDRPRTVAPDDHRRSGQDYVLSRDARVGAVESVAVAFPLRDGLPHDAADREKHLARLGCIHIVHHIWIQDEQGSLG
jgi:hypothetical protein